MSSNGKLNAILVPISGEINAVNQLPIILCTFMFIGIVPLLDIKRKVGESYLSALIHILIIGSNSLFNSSASTLNLCEPCTM